MRYHLDMELLAAFEIQRVGRQAALRFVRRSVKSGLEHSRSERANVATFPSSFMKKPSRSDQPSEPSRRNQQDCRKKSGSEGKWSFNLASESLFSLGAIGQARRVAYRTPTGELRFLPL